MTNPFAEIARARCFNKNEHRFVAGVEQSCPLCEEFAREYLAVAQATLKHYDECNLDCIALESCLADIAKRVRMEGK